MKKVIRNKKVAILYSPGFGAGWYTWNTNYPEAIFLPEIVKIVEEGKQAILVDEDLMYSLLKKEDENRDNFHYYCGGAGDLEIQWLEEGTHFDINEYDGSESIVTFDHIKLIA